RPSMAPAVPSSRRRYVRTMSGSRRIAPTMSSKFRRIVVFPAMTASGEGTWNRSPLLNAAGSAFFARDSSSSYPNDTDQFKGRVSLKVAGSARGLANEPEVDRGRPQRTGAQLRMELRGDEVRMPFQFQDFHPPPVVRPAEVSQARILQLGDIPGVDLVSVSVPFVDRRGPVELGGRGLRVQ